MKQHLLLLLLLFILLGCANEEPIITFMETDASRVVHFEFNEKVKINDLSFVLINVHKISDNKYLLGIDIDEENLSILNNKYTLHLATDDMVYKLSSQNTEQSEDGKVEVYIVSDNFTGVPSQIVIIENKTLKIKGAVNISLNN